jgi:hypothetical protein
MQGLSKVSVPGTLFEKNCARVGQESKQVKPTTSVDKRSPSRSATNTPKHATWLNQAEIEISVFERGCLSRPVGDVPTLEQRVRALEDERNARHATIDWQFTNRQARVKLKKLYPVVKAQPD